jgi:cell division protein FtsI/penicillin-binding protein 2
MVSRLLLLFALLTPALFAYLGAPAAAAEPTLRQLADSLASADTGVVVASARSGEELYAGGFAGDAMPPGSVFKLVVALAAAYERPEALARPRYCPPETSPQAAGPDGLVHSHGHGWIDLEDALAHSCNRYFEQLGGELGAARLWRTAGRLAPGWPRVRPPAIPAAELALGTGVRMTAHQQVALLRTVATDWISAGQEAPPPAALRRIREGLCRSVSSGTAHGVALRHEAFTICGKTGTSLLDGSTVGWFSGYAPAEEPEIIIIVGLRHKLGRDAARAARDLFGAYFTHR